MTEKPMKIEPSSDELSYQRFLGEVKARVSGARLAAARAVNREHIGLYWNLGALIVERQESMGRGQSIFERLASDLRAEAANSPTACWRNSLGPERPDRSTVQEDGGALGVIDWKRMENGNRYASGMLLNAAENKNAAG